MDGKGQVPDHLRCRRSDGKRWRCSRLALKHVSFCALHHGQARRRQYKLPVPDSLKLRHGRCGRLPSSTTESSSRKKVVEEEEEKEDVLERNGNVVVKRRRRRKKIEGLLVELMRMVLKRKIEKREEEEEMRRQEQTTMEMEVMRKQLPNGLMAISPVSNVQISDHPRFDRKLDHHHPRSFLRWCFRSKNVGSVPVGTVKKFPYVKRATGLMQKPYKDMPSLPESHISNHSVIKLSKNIFSQDV